MSQRRVITEEDIGLGCKSEVGKLEESLRESLLREARWELLGSSTAGSEGSSHQEAWRG